MPTIKHKTIPEEINAIRKIYSVLVGTEKLYCVVCAPADRYHEPVGSDSDTEIQIHHSIGITLKA